ncbi:hypothetical protein [Amycolatopsis sp. NPDC051071]|uniref:hypothetical protein n=1 Tax=Amycolatopsis sp. NPDC051071 TaxID=3154637 RepID=UPI003432B075
MMKCRKCGRTLADRAGPGRKPVYCSPGCRRAAEYELRRIQRALEALEDEHRDIRLNWPPFADRLPLLEAERDRLEIRLRELLDDDTETRA